MGPDQPLPLPAEWEQSGGGAEAFVESLLRFGTTSTTLRTLCGGVHILDFLTREPDLYSLVLPAGWRDYFARDDVDVAAVLDLLMRRDLGELRSPSSGGDGPPEDLLAFVADESTKETFNGIPKGSKKAKLHLLEEGGGSIQYIEHRLEDGNLDHVVQQILDPAKVAEQQEQDTQTKERADQPFLTSTPAVTSTTRAQDPNLMVISLHSCGNLVHHGLRSLILNPSVKAVAMIGCCYNLMTERLGPPSYKLPQLRPNHPRLEATANAFDPHGFPMSARYATYPIPETDGSEVGVRLNITARMMAVQAPQNWGAADSEAFFTRHFFRALLQRVFLDRGVVGPPRSNGAANLDAEMWQGRTVGPCSPAGCSSGGEPVVIGSLKKSCYADFVAYVRGALAKIEANAEQPARAEQVRRLMGDITDEEIRGYEEAYGRKKKELSVVWSLMAFAAGVVEAMIVVDRWLWLGEQEGIEKAWVEPVFDYAMSPRNLVVVGLKK
ncbi:hypothetical protein UCRNP2_6430 [Neofusicoccum parvum UCRNP2]|uniref:Methyltransferase domain-containing protein n=1 Tax=Botryosphaeria parva (strain UCR-NP2) TaxID=1287680 RepID=R1EH37_BOTPV|nr:hypothetical protein UCRNP2_6430 [Neofusicoccum parvum UCRNP2]